MTNIFEFPSKANQPDPEFLLACDYGVVKYRFAVSYVHDGKTFGEEIWADSLEDAEQRAVSIRESLIVDGQLYGSVDA